MQVVLASASPRRLELISQLGWEAQVHPSAFEEAGGSASEAKDVVLANALGKGRWVAEKLGDELPIIGADTVVVVDNVILGKPKDAADAAMMLKRLSGREHQVMTGVAIFYKGKVLGRVCVTKVFFRSLTEHEITGYVATGEPLDKAGAYGIQGQGAVLVEKIDGCYNNVVGLPLTMMYTMFKELGVELSE